MNPAKIEGQVFDPQCDPSFRFHLASQNLPPDDHFLDILAALDNLQDLGFPPVPGHVALFQDGVSAVQLDRFIGRLSGKPTVPLLSYRP